MVVTVAILAVLVAVGLPIFGAIQNTARVNTLKDAANDAASQVSVALHQKASRSEAQAIIDKLNRMNGTTIAYALAPEGITTDSRNTPVKVDSKLGVARDIQGAFAANNDSPEKVYVYAIDKHQNIHATGTARKSWTWPGDA
jgi:type II secretory pathway pseudopilin PulG